MEHPLRPYASAGVALAGASLIAITPMAGPGLDIQAQAQARAVQLASVGSGLTDLTTVAAGQDYPIVTPAELVTDTQTNLQALEAQISADPSPILEQIIANQTVYSTDLTTAAQNASSDLMSAVQGLPDVLQQASADFASGDVYDGLFSPYSYLLTSLLDVDHDLLNGTSQVAQGIADNIANLFTNPAPVLANVTGVIGENSVPSWLSDLVTAPLYGPNAALAGFSGVSQDIVTAANSGDYSTVMSDLANAPSTITDAFLNGYQIDATTPIPAMADLVARIAEINPDYGFLTGAPEAVTTTAPQSFAELVAAGRGTIENLLLARETIAGDLGANRAVEAFDAQSGPLTELLSGATGTTGLPDLSTVVGDVTSALNPSTLLGDLTAMFEPSAATDIGTSLSADLSGLLLSLF